MNKRNSIILGLLFVILAVEIVVLAPKELGISPSVDAASNHLPGAGATPSASGASQIISDAHLVDTRSETKEWELWADRAQHGQEGEQWSIEKVRAKFFGSDGVVYTVTGRRGKVTPNRNDIQIEGDVVTRSSNGYTFKTESVFYDPKKRLLRSPKQVEMIGVAGEGAGGPLRLTGNEMLAEFTTNQININRNVKARKLVDKDRTAVIQSERAVFSGKSDLARFFGNVTVDFDTMRLTGPEASFSYGRKTQSLDSLQVVGGVRLTDTDKFATSGEVNVNFKENKIVFNGSPRVVQNGDELIGDEIVFLDGGRKVQVSNAKAQIDPRSVEKRN